jgi:hypothetical protein
MGPRLGKKVGEITLKFMRNITITKGNEVN